MKFNANIRRYPSSEGKFVCHWLKSEEKNRFQLNFSKSKKCNSLKINKRQLFVHI